MSFLINIAAGINLFIYLFSFVGQSFLIRLQWEGHPAKSLAVLHSVPSWTSLITRSLPILPVQKNIELQHEQYHWNDLNEKYHLSAEKKKKKKVGIIFASVRFLVWCSKPLGQVSIVGNNSLPLSLQYKIRFWASLGRTMRNTEKREGFMVKNNSKGINLVRKPEVGVCRLFALHF